ncbi:2,3-butanediol dehydrogenase [Halomarina salina]|uniref:2,3-butanediol dehydrogenase n=1 Tax=Halomarina salina TaxID=1872699 RepID=A0ABD5RTE1_9EURY|nr:2,3-butanediol dehydrogenase [Halomarina salina]
MRAARYYGPQDVRVEEVEPQSLGPNQVRVEVAACGICGSDLHEYAAGPITIPDSPHPVTGESLPITIGHEFAGTVTEGGDGAEVSTGTEVAVNPIVWCGDCRYCAEGNYHLCASGGFVGLSGGGGGFAENVVVSADQVVPLPEAVPVEVAALAEPFTVGVHAVERSGLGLGDSVAVFGSGPIGLAVVQAAAATGADPVYVSEPNPHRRELAEECGADEVLDPTATDPVEYLTERTDGGVDVTFEVAGVEPSLNQALTSTRSGGTTTIVSLFEEAVSIEPIHLVTAERTVVGTAAFHGGPRSAEEFGVTLEKFASGAFDPEPLITSRIDLGDVVDEGFERLLDEESDAVKVLVEP